MVKLLSLWQIDETDSVMTLVIYSLYHVACSSATLKFALTKHCDLNYNKILSFLPE